jgi:hypothetical protein
MTEIPSLGFYARSSISGRYVRAAVRKLPSLTGKHVSPHTFRHYLPFRTMSRRVVLYARHQ